MKKIFTLFVAAFIAASAMAQSEVVTLDLTKATTELSFDKETGAWDKTSSTEDEASVIESQCFLFMHNVDATYGSWSGFTVSNSANDSIRSNYFVYQYSNMAKGGIVLDENGAVKRDEKGNIEVSDTVPYLVSYWSGFAESPTSHAADMIFNDGMAHEVVGVYVNLNSYAYYSIMFGDSFARSLNKEGDFFTLTIHGVHEDATEATVDVKLSSFTEGDMTINRGWKYVDLSSLGKVNELYFTMSSSDSNVYGMCTPSYFCLDKLMVKSDATGVQSVGSDNGLTYDYASHTLKLAEPAFVTVCNTKGQQVIATEAGSIDLSTLDCGVYVAKSGNKVIKIVR